MPTILDEVSLAGGLSGVALGFVMATWYDVYPDIAFRGLLFAGMSLAGLIFLFLSKPVVAFLFADFKQFLITVLFILAGVAATLVVQTFVVSVGEAAYLSTVPDDVIPVYLAEAAISETYFYFGLAALFGHLFHPVVAVPIPASLSYFMHQFVYGAMPALIWAVVASFLVQSVLFLLTNRVSVPFGIHLVVNFL